MIKNHPYDEYLALVKPALKSKREEFAILGLKTVTDEEIWNFLVKKKWKRPQEDIHLHSIVSSIMSIQAGEYMNFATVEAFKSPSVFADLSEEELKDLLSN
ncbi:post-transcriptional regulator [Peribacillus saganii]|uniref:Post-transcriptional regulator n=1 Tax=Peribacillus saganii TaxID=2303992 RepID=A0A372LUY4_9BACI|nr:post-transcriptional regulator [Peribacillus saganii]RFU71610.1 post-transcriptional regulator [Peribacillus saganii]